GSAVCLVAALAVCVLLTQPAVAQVDPSGSWHTWHTTHFRVHARAGQDALALRAAAEAERAYAALASELVPPRGTIDLTLADNVDFTNGFASVVPSNRITIFTVPPAGSVVLGHYDDWLRTVITHELVHLFHGDRSRGVWRLFQRIFGRAPGLFPNAYQPSWVAEGLATYYESKLTSAGRLRGGVHGQLLAAAARDRWPLPGDATLASPRWPAGFLPYAWGSFFFERLARDHGDSVPARLVERTAGQLIPFRVSGAVRRAGGAPVRDVWDGLRAEWERATSGEPRGGVLVRGLRGEPRARISPDGTRLAYLHADGKNEARVIVRERASGRALASHRVNAGVDLAWVDADALVVSNLDYRNAVEVRSGLYRWEPGRSWRRISGSESLARPFALARGTVGAVDVASDASRVVSLADGGTRGAVALPPAVEWARLAVSPAGDWMAGARHDGRQWDIVAWRAADPSSAVPVTQDAWTDDDPRWTPDGSELLFTSERLGLAQVFAWRPADGTVRQLTDEPTGARDASVGPKGELVYATVLADGFALIERPAAGGEPAAVDRTALLMAPASPAAPAGAVEARRTGYTSWPSLRPHFWLPVFHDAGTAGEFGGALIAGVDALGRASYGALLAVAPDRSRWESVLALEYTRWKAASLDLSYELDWSARLGTVQQTGQRVSLALAEEFATAGLTLRWLRWRRAAAVRVGAELETNALRNDSPVSLTLPALPDYVNGVVSLSAQHLSRPALAISPENGARVGVAYRRRRELGGQGWSEEARGAVNGYVALPLPGFAHWVLAARAAGGVSRGPNRAYFDLGGESGDVFRVVSGYTLGSGRRQFSLRGYDEMGGFDRVGAGAVELRIPLALVGRGVWRLPFGLDRISLAAFGEAARARYVDGSVLDFGDLGAEAVLDLAVSYDVPLRLRLGGAVPFTSGVGNTVREPRWYVTFGSSF
ncbi:MAG TPA: hypothetical protein VNL98_02465, partial [Gemmatimonadales bacterium]|nr:hypothetical protein [Gemmatimonadales bacterium]